MGAKNKVSAEAPKLPRRLLMTADTVGGVWTYALELASALKEHGIEVALATMGARLSREQRKACNQLPNVDVFESNFKLEWMADPWTDVARAGDWLLRLEQDLRPDLIHLNNFVHGSLPWSSPTIVVGHSCVLSWWKAVKGEEAPESWTQYRTSVGNGIRAADLVIAPSHAMLEQLRRYYGPFPTGKVIYNARNAAFFRNLVKQEFILAAGRVWDEAKNIAMVNLVASQVPWKIYVAGEARPPTGPALPHGMVQPLGKLSSQVLSSWLGRAPIFVAPAHYEPFGLSVLEAGLSGCALVVGDIPSLREIWSDAAVFVSPHDPMELKMALDWLISDRLHRKQMAANAQCRAIQFNPKQLAHQYLAAYSEVLIKSDKRRREEALCAY
jgi:glycogen(starch) synthase